MFLSTPPTHPEVSLFLERLEMVSEKELKYKIAIYIALFAGLRKSEILGLDWEHFNPVKQSLRIEQTRLIGRAVGVYTDSTKTLKSVRTITIPVELSNMLSQLKAQQEHTAELLGSEWDHSPGFCCKKSLLFLATATTAIIVPLLLQGGYKNG